MTAEADTGTSSSGTFRTLRTGDAPRRKREPDHKIAHEGNRGTKLGPNYPEYKWGRHKMPFHRRHWYRLYSERGGVQTTRRPPDEVLHSDIREITFQY